VSGFAPIRCGPYRALVRRDLLPLADALLRSEGERMNVFGRGRCERVRAAGRLFVRKRLAHGGLLAPLLGPRFLRRGRLADAIRNFLRLRAADVPVAPVAAVAWSRVAGTLRLVLVTEYLPGVTLAEHLRAGGSFPYAALADTLRRAFDAGFAPVDLTPENLRVLPGGDVALLDIEDAGLRSCALPSRLRTSILVRFGRALFKRRFMPGAVSRTALLRLLLALEIEPRGYCAALAGQLRLHRIL